MTWGSAQGPTRQAPNCLSHRALRVVNWSSAIPAQPGVIAVVLPRHCPPGLLGSSLLLGGPYKKVWLQYAGPVVGRHSPEEGNL